MAKDLEEVVNSHTVQMAMMSGKLDMIVDGMDDMRLDLKEMSTTQKAIVVLMERMENHEENTKKAHDDMRESFKAVHTRIRRVEEDTLEIQKQHQAKYDLITPIIKKGEDAHKTLVFIAKAIAGVSITTVCGLIIWAIEQGGVQ